MLRPVVLLLLLGGVASAGDVPAPLCGLVPGWTQSGAARTYTADNLSEYMDGNSEGYIRYNFQEMRGITCKKGNVTFVIDISDMGEPDFAYGWFSANRDLRQPEYPVGMGGQIVPRRLVFAKGPYYVEIAADPDLDHTANLQAFAAALAKLVPGDDKPPAVLDWFPKENLDSLKLVPESVLGLRILKRGYVAQYPHGKAFVVEDESAKDVMLKLKARFGETTAAKIGDEAFVAADQYLGRLCIFRKGRYVGGYAVSDTGLDPSASAAKLAAKIP